MLHWYLRTLKTIGPCLDAQACCVAAPLLYLPCTAELHPHKRGISMARIDHFEHLIVEIYLSLS
ncbi:hypothetical protein PanWU01x14_185880, partial [Parasponia andersonii]